MSRRGEVALWLVAIALLLVLLQMRFVLHKGEGRDSYRMDRWTGRVVPLASLTSPREHRQTRSMKDWSPITIEHHGNVKLTLTTKWRDGSFFYRFSISPLSKEIQKARGSTYSQYTILLQDVDGFPVDEVSVPLSEMTRVVDNKGKATHLKSEGRRPMTLESYDAIDGWNIKWVFPE